MPVGLINRTHYGQVDKGRMKRKRQVTRSIGRVEPDTAAVEVVSIGCTAVGSCRGAGHDLNIVAAELMTVVFMRRRFRRRTVTAVMRIGIPERHRTGLQRQIQPDEREQATCASSEALSSVCPFVCRPSQWSLSARWHP